MICKEKGCGKKVVGRGWCSMHYQRWQECGDSNFTKIEMHGYRNHFLYNVWCHMKARCYNKNNIGYEYYGGRGIKICDKWKNSAKAFIEWAKSLWKQGLQIDRRDNDGDYCPENCRFVTPKENCDNRRLLISTNKSRYRGVSEKNKKWVAQITINNKNKHIGYFDTPEEAAMAYDRAVPDGRPRNFK